MIHLNKTAVSVCACLLAFAPSVNAEWRTATVLTDENPVAYSPKEECDYRLKMVRRLPDNEFSHYEIFPSVSVSNSAIDFAVSQNHVSSSTGITVFTHGRKNYSLSTLTSSKATSPDHYVFKYWRDGVGDPQTYINIPDGKRNSPTLILQAEYTQYDAIPEILDSNGSAPGEDGNVRYLQYYLNLEYDEYRIEENCPEQDGLIGDVNFDGKVDYTDIKTVYLNLKIFDPETDFNSRGVEFFNKQWKDGDFDGDGDVDYNDFFRTYLAYISTFAK